MSSPAIPANISPFGRLRAGSIGSVQSNPSRLLSQQLSSSVASGPIRSFINPARRENLASLNTTESARSVREDTAELAIYQLADKSGGSGGSPSFLQRDRSRSFRTTFSDGDIEDVDEALQEEQAEEAAEAEAETRQAQAFSLPQPNAHQAQPQDNDNASDDEGPSLLTRALRRSPPQHVRLFEEHPSSGTVFDDDIHNDEHSDETLAAHAEVDVHDTHSLTDTDASHAATEETPLLGAGPDGDLESQKAPGRGSVLRLFGPDVSLRAMWRAVATRKAWDRKALWANVVVAPVACLPAVIVGLLLNILDALSYGMILFPLGSPIFAHLGSAGISIFYVSTIVSQLVFSSGSIFRGGIGSELIEVVPFFHSMALTITDLVGEDKPDAVIATTITAYALSTLVTGSVFFLMGKFQFGYIVGFIPRHILIGCIGGVGWFLVATGFEVTARIDGSLNYDLDTLHKLLQGDTVLLWLIPLVLSVALFWGQKHVTSKYFLPLYILAIPLVFYVAALVGGPIDPQRLRQHGWVFEGPPADEPWWFFYTLYKFDQVQWSAIVDCIPAMFALTFFGILHVPINVPALALQIGEDHADLSHELRLHGYSNLLSGLLGSIQNYLVYANTLFFIRSGGNSRLAGFELAALTFGVMLVGPQTIGFIPIMMVGCLIFDLGFELLVEAVWLPRRKLKRAEYLTVLAIVLIMGMYDFVAGIGAGILLAFVSLIVQASRVSAVRSTCSGENVSSTVRRNAAQQRYLRQVGGQISVVKLAGYLFFGTIVGVEARMRALITNEAFARRPLRFLILDLRQVTGLDYSAGEAFNTISRLLDGRGIRLVISGVDADSRLGRDLRAVGLGEDGVAVVFLPEINTALELCENELLKTLYAAEAALHSTAPRATAILLAPPLTATTTTSNNPVTTALASSPRRHHLQMAATELLAGADERRVRWQSFAEPLRLLLQIFEEVSERDVDFWFRASRYFEARHYDAAALLFCAGAVADGFFLLERGVVRAEYRLAHGQRYHETIVAGTTCGELPFFSETPRTATVSAETECAVWVLGRDAWLRLQRDDADMAGELLRVALKLTAERMATVPSSIMLMAE